MTVPHARSDYFLQPTPDFGSDIQRTRFRILSLDPDLQVASIGVEGAAADLRRRREGSSAVGRLAMLTGSSISPMFVWPDPAPAVDLAALQSLAASLYGPGRPGAIPAAYTYLTQFVAHEICRTEYLDPNDSKLVSNSRSFGLDLDSIYNGAPLEDDGRRLRLGVTSLGRPFDLPLGDDLDVEIGNSRNDANLALSQLHCAFMRFHNAVADAYPEEDYCAVRNQVTLSFRKMLIDDWLPRMTSQALVDRMKDEACDRFIVRNSRSICPAEAVLAAFRVGHSMARSFYDWNNSHDSMPFIRLMSVTRPPPGRERITLPPDWVIDWTRFLPGKDGSDAVNLAMRIDAAIVSALSDVPPSLVEIHPNETSAAYRTLWFGAHAGMIDGFQAQTQLSAALGNGEFQMTPVHLEATKDGRKLDRQRHRTFLEHPPLWWFILCEADHFGKDGGLAGVGARILAESLFAALDASPVEGAIWDGLPGWTGKATLSGIIRFGGASANWHGLQYA